MLVLNNIIRVSATATMYFGGALLLAETMIVFSSVLRGIFFGRPFSWDFEAIKFLNSLIVFSFLPYTQLTNGHVAADLFTTRASPQYVSFIDCFSHFLFGLFALLLLWRMSLGSVSYYDPVFPEVTTILEIPVWWVFPPILVTLTVWAAVCFFMAFIRNRAVEAGG